MIQWMSKHAKSALSAGLSLALLSIVQPVSGQCSADATNRMNNAIQATPSGAARTALKDRNKVNCTRLNEMPDETVDGYSRIVKDCDETGHPDDAKVDHVIRAGSVADMSLEATEEYWGAVDFFRNGDGSLKPGIATQATPNASRNIKRVGSAGQANAKAEAWELVATKRMVDRGDFTVDGVESFGAKIDISESLGQPAGTTFVESDCYATSGSERYYMDHKHTTGSQTTISLDHLDKLGESLKAAPGVRKFDRALFPVNKNPSQPVLDHIDDWNDTLNDHFKTEGIEYIRVVNDLGDFQ